MSATPSHPRTGSCSQRGDSVVITTRDAVKSERRRLRPFADIATWLDSFVPSRHGMSSNPYACGSKQEWTIGRSLCIRSGAASFGGFKTAGPTPWAPRTGSGVEADYAPVAACWHLQATVTACARAHPRPCAVPRPDARDGDLIDQGRFVPDTKRLEGFAKKSSLQTSIVNAAHQGHHSCLWMERCSAAHRRRSHVGCTRGLQHLALSLITHSMQNNANCGARAGIWQVCREFIPALTEVCPKPVSLVSACCVES